MALPATTKPVYAAGIYRERYGSRMMVTSDENMAKKKFPTDKIIRGCITSEYHTKNAARLWRAVFFCRIYIPMRTGMTIGALLVRAKRNPAITSVRLFFT